MHTHRLYKNQKLCSVTAITALFGRDASNFTAAAFPIRAFWRYDDGRSGAPLQFFISVPKKRVRHAVDRVKMRRRIREAYRLQQHDIEIAVGHKVNVAFIYVDSKLHSYDRISRSMQRLLQHISTHTKQSSDEPKAELQ